MVKKFEKNTNNTLSNTSFQHILSHLLKFMWVALWVFFFFLFGRTHSQSIKTPWIPKDSVSRSVIECVNDTFGNNDLFTYTCLPNCHDDKFHIILGELQSFTPLYNAWCRGTILHIGRSGRHRDITAQRGKLVTTNIGVIHGRGGGGVSTSIFSLGMTKWLKSRLGVYG